MRVANNGVSGVVDPAGRVSRRTRLDASAMPTWRCRRRRRRTLYARAGDWIFLALLLLGAAPVALRLR